MNTLYSKVESDWNENFIGYSALAIILSTCVGSIAVMTTMMNGNGMTEMILLFFVVAACTTHNASILTLQKPSLVLKLLIASLSISTVVFLMSFL